MELSCTVLKILMGMIFSIIIVCAICGIYMEYRLGKIFSFLVENNQTPFDIQVINRAQKRFWVWPIEKALK